MRKDNSSQDEKENQNENIHYTKENEIRKKQKVQVKKNVRTSTNNIVLYQKAAGVTQKSSNFSSVDLSSLSSMTEQNRNGVKLISNLNTNLNFNTFTKSTMTKNINEDTIYLDKENSILLKDYGAEIYNYNSKVLQSEVVTGAFLKRHKINPEIRLKMVDWMIEVLSVYKSEPDTFFLSVHIMDMFINSSKMTIRNESIHLLGITSMFLASKQEDVIPIRMHSIVSKISHEVFKSQEIRLKEKQIVECIGFENLITTSIYEFIKTFFFDFLYNNKDNLRILKIREGVSQIEGCSVFFSMLTMHFEEFYNYNLTLKAIACIIAAFDLVRTNTDHLSEDGEKFIREWILFLIRESPFSQDTVALVYSKIVDYYNKYDKISSINHNLTKYRPIQFNSYCLDNVSKVI